MSLKHTIITRVNVLNDWLHQHPGRRAHRRMLQRQWDPNYLWHRVKLFHKYTVPSMESQINQDFDWVVLLHPRTDLKLKEAFSPDRATVVEVIGDTDALSYFQNDGWIATTNLDSDDALAFDFTKRFREVVQEKNYVISFQCGYHFSARSDLAVRRRSPTNAYNTLVERGENPKTIIPYVHGHFDKYYEVNQITSPPMWLQVVHGQNVENHRVRHSKKSVDISLKEIKRRFKIDE